MAPEAVKSSFCQSALRLARGSATLSSHGSKLVLRSLARLMMCRRMCRRCMYGYLGFEWWASGSVSWSACILALESWSRHAISGSKSRLVTVYTSTVSACSLACCKNVARTDRETCARPARVDVDGQRLLVPGIDCWPILCGHISDSRGPKVDQ